MDDLGSTCQTHSFRILTRFCVLVRAWTFPVQWSFAVAINDATFVVSTEWLTAGVIMKIVDTKPTPCHTIPAISTLV